MGTIAHQLDDVVGVAEKVLAVGERGAVAVAPAVGNYKAEAFLGQRSLLDPFLGADGERAVHEHDSRPLAP
jgi:hypothetical protein